MNRGAQLLQQWLTKRTLSRVEGARELGLSKGYMSQLLNGDRTPSRGLALSIANHTGVAVADWDAAPLSKSDEKLRTVNSGRKSGAKSTSVCKV